MSYYDEERKRLGIIADDNQKNEPNRNMQDVQNSFYDEERRRLGLIAGEESQTQPIPLSNQRPRGTGFRLSDNPKEEVTPTEDTAKEESIPSSVLWNSKRYNDKLDGFYEKRDEVTGPQASGPSIDLNKINPQNLDSTAKNTILAYESKRAQDAKDSQTSEWKADEIRNVSPSRFGQVLTGAAMEYAGNVANTASTLTGSSPQMGFTDYAYKKITENPESLDPETRKILQEQLSRNLQSVEGQKELEEKLKGWGYETAEKGAQNIESAKEGLGFLGNLAVDLGVGVTQLGMDAAINTVTGGARMLPLFLRAFGGAEMQARKEGASENEALLYGLGIGGLEAATEGMWNFGSVMGKVYGKGLLDNLGKTQIDTVIQNLSRQVAKSAAGRNIVYNVLKLIPAFGSEAVEEMVSEAVSPMLEKAIYNPDAKPAGWGEIFYSGLVGGIIGAIAGSGSQIISTNRGAAYNTPQILPSIIDIGKVYGKDSTPFKMAINIESKLNSNEAIPNAEVDTLLQEIVSASTEGDKTKVYLDTNTQQTGNKNEDIKRLNINVYSQFREAENLLSSKEKLSETEQKRLKEISNTLFDSIKSGEITAKFKPYYASALARIEKHTEAITGVYRVGKIAGDTNTVHRDYLSRTGASATLNAVAPTNEYDIVRTNAKTGQVDYIKVDDFDNNPEPIITKITTVNKDGSVKVDIPRNKILNDKSAYVGNDYAGFDVTAAKERESAWKNSPKKGGPSYDPTKIYDKDYFDEYMKSVEEFYKGKEKEKTPAKTEIEYGVETKMPASKLNFESDDVKKSVESSQGRIDAFKEIIKTGKDGHIFKAKDILAPILVLHKDGDFIAYDGNHRLMAYKQLDENYDVPVIIYQTYEEYKAAIREISKEEEAENEKLGFVKDKSASIEKAEESSNIKGLESYSESQLKNRILEYVNDVLDEKSYEPVRIVQTTFYGSRAKGTSTDISDLDVILEYEGDVKEDEMFNMLNEESLYIDDIQIDINPIRAEQSGTTEEYIETLERYAAEDNASKKKEAPTTTAETENEVSTENVGYHAGNLGKSESLGSQSGRRGTGHFGTGTYFVGNKEKIKDYNKRDGNPAPIHVVDFSDYNLFKPKNNEEAVALHEFLKVLNNYSTYSGIRTLAEYKELIEETEEIDDEYNIEEDPEAEQRYLEIARLIIGNYGVNRIFEKYIDRANVDSQSGDIFNSETGEVLSYAQIKKQVGDRYWRAIVEIEKKMKDARIVSDIKYYESWHNSIKDIASILNISQDKAIEARDKSIAESFYIRKIYSPMELYKQDSTSTRFMKSLGYEGVDVRHIDRLDNTEYGSVIYDLKTDAQEKPQTEIEPKPETTEKPVESDETNSPEDVKGEEQAQQQATSEVDETLIAEFNRLNIVPIQEYVPGRAPSSKTIWSMGSLKISSKMNGENSFSNGHWMVIAKYCPAKLLENQNIDEFDRSDRDFSYQKTDNELIPIARSANTVDEFIYFKTKDNQLLVLNLKYYEYFLKNGFKFEKGPNSAILVKDDNVAGVLMGVMPSKYILDNEHEAIRYIESLNKKTLENSVNTEDNIGGGRKDEHSLGGISKGVSTEEVQKPQGDRPINPDFVATTRGGLGPIRPDDEGSNPKTEGRGDLAGDSIRTKQGDRHADEGNRGNRQGYDGKQNIGYGYILDNASESMEKATKIERYDANVAAIELLKTIQEENRAATADEMDVLSKYTGWGGLNDAFIDYEKGPWKDRVETLKNLLSKSQYKSARESTLTAYYTPAATINSIYKMLNRMGFDGGNILEPSCGTGKFLGVMPDKIRKQSNIAGVEMDEISGNIAKLLYPNAKIFINGFEKTEIIPNSVDAIVGNVPFGDIKLYDSQYKDYKKYNIHDYFVLKSLDSLAEGGVMAVLTTTGTLDKADTSVRELMKEKAVMVAAFRLPSKTFANTDVVADLLIMQKRGEGVLDEGIDFIPTGSLQGVLTNKYFITHPENVLGDISVTTNQYGAKVLAVSNNGMSLSDVVSFVPANLISDFIRSKSEKEDVERGNIVNDIDKSSIGTIFFENGSLQIINDEGKPENFYTVTQSGDNEGKKTYLKETSKDYKRVQSLLKLIERYDEVSAVQEKTEDDALLKKAQKKLNEVYDKHIKDFGPVNHSRSERFFKSDPRYYKIASIEDKVYENGKEAYVKGDFFRTRTIPKKNPIRNVGNAEEALYASFNIKNSVDLDYMSEIYHKEPSKILIELGEKVYEDPENPGTYVLREQYLSGDVKAKLKYAQEHNENGTYYSQIKALEKVIPADLSAEDISIQLGTPWVGTETVRDFVQQIFNEENPDAVRVGYSKFNSSWFVEYRGYGSHQANSRWGTPEKPFIDLIQKILNKSPITVTEKDSFGRSYVNEEATKRARAKADEIKEYFKDWVFKDIDRRERLVRLYNDTFNNTVNRKYDGSYLKMYGTSIELRPHQSSSVARMLAEKNTLLAHPVGSGKTYAMIGAIHELRRMNLVQKPMLIVPNHKLKDFMTDYYKMYPNAKLLTVSQKDFNKSNRLKMLAKIKSTNFECVIIRHSSFENFGFSPEYESNYIEKQIDRLEAAIRSSKDVMSKRDISNMEKRLKTLKDKLAELLDTETDDIVPFDESGIDAIFVDEAHNFKNLENVTKLARVPGANTGKSAKATRMHMATEYIHDRNGRIVFATATPISNTIGELYSMIRYLRPDLLHKYGMDSFDAWGETFGEIVSNIEPNVTGTKLITKERFSRFKNVPEMIRMFKEFADIVNKDELKIPLPEVRTHHVTIDSNKVLDKYNKRLEIKKKNMTYEEAKKAGHLVLMQDARMASLDLRTVYNLLIEEGIITRDVSLDDLDNPNSKINRAIKQIEEIYNNSSDIKGAQLVFLDRGTPKKARNKKDDAKYWNLIRKDQRGEELTAKEEEYLAEKISERRYQYELYADIKAKLIASGIPENEIAFIQDTATGDSDKKIQTLINKVNKGAVRILIGSTSMMGEGMNVQERAVALHHLDAPMRPSDVEQRNGRLVRQGNTNKEVDIFYYSTKNSYDAPMWKMLERKAKAINQIMLGDEYVREIEDVDDNDFASMSVEAANNPLMFERKDITDRISKLKYKKKNIAYEQFSYQEIIKNYNKNIETEKRWLETFKKEKEIAAKNEDQKLIFEGKEYDTFKEAGEDLIKKAQERAYMDHINEPAKIGKLNGLDIKIKRLSLAGDYRLYIGSYLSVSATLDKSEGGYKESDQKLGTAFLRLKNQLKHIDALIEDSEKRIARIESEYKNAKENIGKEFEGEEELRRLSERLIEIDLILQETSKKTGEAESESESEAIDRIREDLWLNHSQNLAGTNGTHGELYEPNYRMKIDQSDVDPKITEPQGRLKSISEIINDIRRDFNLPIVQGRYSARRSLGQYLPARRVIKTKNFNEIGVVCHELGHHFDSKYKITENHDSELRRMASKFKDDTKARYRAAELNNEAIAEFLRLYIVDPYGAKEFGTLQKSNFYDIFEQMISSEDRRRLLAVRADVVRFLNANALEQMKTTIVKRSDKQKDERSFKKKAEDNYVKYVDGYYSAKRMVDFLEQQSGKKVSPKNDVYLLAKRADRADTIAHSILTRGLTAPNSDEILAPSFDSILKPVKHNLENFNVYLKTLHSLEWEEQGKKVYPSEISIESQKNVIAQMEKEFPEFIMAARNLHSWFDTFERAWLVDTGFVEKRVYEKLRRLNPNYVPNFRVKKDKSGISSSKNQLNPLRYASQHGSDLDTYDPIESIINEVARIVKAEMRREVTLSLHRMYQQEEYAEGLSFFITKTRPDVQKHTFDATDLKDKLGQEMFEQITDQLTPLENTILQIGSYKEQKQILDKYGFTETIETINQVIENYIDFYTAKKTSSDEEVITVLDNGQTTFYKVNDEDLLVMLENMNPKDIGSLVSTMGKLKRAFTILTTGGNPIFGITSNIFRDIPMAYVLGSTANPFKFAKDLIVAYADILRKSENYLSYKAFGGGFESILGEDSSYVKRATTQTEKHIKRGTKEHVVYTLSRILDAIEEFNNLIETAPRLAEYNRLVSNGADKMVAVHKANALTTDFAQKPGSKGLSELEMVTPFMRAGVNGLDRVYRGLFKDKEGRKDAWIKAMVCITIPSILMAIAHRDDDEYNKLPDYYKDNYWMINKEWFGGEKGKFIRIPKTRELGWMFGATFDRAINEVLNEEEDNGRALSISFRDTFVPSVDIILMPIIDAYANKTWSGGEIVSSVFDDYMIPGYYNQVYDDTTSRISVALASMLPDINTFGPINTPKGIEYLLKQYSGVLGQVFLPALTPSSEGVIEAAGSKMNVDNAFSNRYVGEFYDILELLQASYRNYKNTNKKDKNYNEAERKKFTSESRTLSKYWAEIRALNNNRDLPQKQKSEKIRNVRLKINEICEKTVKNYKKQLK